MESILLIGIDYTQHFINMFSKNSLEVKNQIDLSLTNHCSNKSSKMKQMSSHEDRRMQSNRKRKRLLLCH